MESVEGEWPWTLRASLCFDNLGFLLRPVRSVLFPSKAYRKFVRCPQVKLRGPTAGEVWVPQVRFLRSSPAGVGEVDLLWAQCFELPFLSV